MTIDEIEELSERINDLDRIDETWLPIISLFMLAPLLTQNEPKIIINVGGK